MHDDDLRPGIDRPRRKQYAFAVLVIIGFAVLAYWLKLRGQI